MSKFITVLEMTRKFHTYVAQNLNNIFSKIDGVKMVMPIASVETPLLAMKMANGVAPIQVKIVQLMDIGVMEIPNMSLANWEHH